MNPRGSTIIEPCWLVPALLVNILQRQELDSIVRLLGFINEPCKQVACRLFMVAGLSAYDADITLGKCGISDGSYLWNL